MMDFSFVRVNISSMIKHCCDTPGYDFCYIPFVSETCRYDLIDKTEKPNYSQNSSYGSESPVGENKRSPGIVRVLLKKLLGDFNVYGDHYDMMRQSLLLRNNMMM